MNKEFGGKEFGGHNTYFSRNAIGNWYYVPRLKKLWAGAPIAGSEQGYTESTL
jgi:hypothetical protein